MQINFPQKEHALYTVAVAKIEENFSFKAYVDLDGGVRLKESFVFNALDFPKKTTARGRKALAHIKSVLKQGDVVVIKTYHKNEFLKRPVDVFYLPGEKDPKKIARKGILLNQELLDLKLADPYDAEKRKLNFMKGIVKMHDKELDLVTGNFKSEICMYINDCKQYLKAGLEGRRVDMEKGEFDPTDEEFLIIYGLKELKDLCMQTAGRSGLDWKD